MRDPRRLTSEFRTAIDAHVAAAEPVRLDRPESDRLLALSLADLRLRSRSPLEALFGVRLIEALSRRRTVGWDPRDSSGRPEETALVKVSDDVRKVVLCCNFRLDRYTFDFWLRSEEPKSGSIVQRTVLVECDGAAWHWGRQIDVDRRKDELAAEFDWCLFRIPSSKIFAGPVKCAEEVVEYLLDGSFRVGGLIVSRSEFENLCSET
jgi:very-short-patch-repair endonuclease